MIKRITQIVCVPISGTIGYWLWKAIEMLLATVAVTLWPWLESLIEIFLISSMAVAGFFVGRPIGKGINLLLSRITRKTKEMPIKDMFLAVIGLTVGFLLAFLVSKIFDKINNQVLVTSINVFLYIVGGFLGVRIFLLRSEDFSFVDRRLKKADEGEKGGKGGTVLDTSILIDGRALDIYKTGFLQTPVYVPKFVLEELSRLADSEDQKKRTRGRIGLDTVKRLRESDDVIISPKDSSDSDNYDDKLIAFAKEHGAGIMTNDYSLNMVASVQGVNILNINELVNALKPTVIAGDEIKIEVSRVGKDPSQGVGYLDDGTMVVVENGAEYLESVVEVTVTSMLQTNAGKIIFGKVRE